MIYSKKKAKYIIYEHVKIENVDDEMEIVNIINPESKFKIINKMVNISYGIYRECKKFESKKE